MNNHGVTDQDNDHPRHEKPVFDQEDIVMTELASCSDAPLKVPVLPKRPLSAYFLFMNARRDSIKACHPEYTIGDISKEMGVTWSHMSEQEKQPFVEQNLQAKAKYAQAKQKLMESGDWGRLHATDEGQRPHELDFPLSRVKKIITLDKSIRRISKDGASVVAKAAAFFLSDLAARCFATETKVAKRKTISIDDLVKTIHHHDVLDWLQDDFPSRTLSESKSATRVSNPRPVVSLADPHARITSFLTTLS